MSTMPQEQPQEMQPDMENMLVEYLQSLEDRIAALEAKDGEDLEDDEEE